MFPSRASLGKAQCSAASFVAVNSVTTSVRHGTSRHHVNIACYNSNSDANSATNGVTNGTSTHSPAASSSSSSCASWLEVVDCDTCRVAARIGLVGTAPTCDLDVAVMDCTFSSSSFSPTQLTVVLSVVTAHINGEVLHHQIKFPIRSSTEPIPAFDWSHLNPVTDASGITTAAVTSTLVPRGEPAAVPVPFLRVKILQRMYVCVSTIEADAVLTMLPLQQSTVAYNITIEMPFYIRDSQQHRHEEQEPRRYFTAIAINQFSSQNLQHASLLKRILTQHDFNVFTSRPQSTVVIVGTSDSYVLYALLPSEERRAAIPTTRMPAQVIDRYARSIASISFADLSTTIKQSTNSPACSHVIVCESDGYLTCLGVQSIVGYYVSSDLEAELVSQAGASQVQPLANCLLYVANGVLYAICAIESQSPNTADVSTIPAPSFFMPALQTSLQSHLRLSHPTCGDIIDFTVDSHMGCMVIALQQFPYLVTIDLLPSILHPDEFSGNNTVSRLRMLLGYLSTASVAQPSESLAHDIYGVEHMSSLIDQAVRREQKLRNQIDSLSLELLNSAALVTLLSQISDPTMLHSLFSWHIRLAPSDDGAQSINSTKLLYIGLETPSLLAVRALQGRSVTLALKPTTAFPSSTSAIPNQCSSTPSLIYSRTLTVLFALKEPSAGAEQTYICQLGNSPLSVAATEPSCALEELRVDLFLHVDCPHHSCPDSSLEGELVGLGDRNMLGSSGFLLFSKVISVSEWMETKGDAANPAMFQALLSGDSSPVGVSVARSMTMEALQQFRSDQPAPHSRAVVNQKRSEYSCLSSTAGYSMEVTLPRVVDAIGQPEGSSETVNRYAASLISLQRLVKHILMEEKQYRDDDIIGGGHPYYASSLLPSFMRPQIVPRDGAGTDDSELLRTAKQSVPLGRTSEPHTLTLDALYLKCKSLAVAATVHHQVARCVLGDGLARDRRSTTGQENVSFTPGDAYSLPGDLQKIFDRAIKLMRSIDVSVRLEEHGSGDRDSTSRSMGMPLANTNVMLDGMLTVIDAHDSLSQLDRLCEQLQELMAIYLAVREPL